MAFGRLERTRPPRPMSDINMTPLIDVMLVLMVLFMLAAPLIASSLKLDLPDSDAASTTEVDPSDILDVGIDAKGQIFLGDQASTDEAVVARARDAARTNPQTEVQLRADRAVPYGRVAELIGAVQKAGLTRIGLVTDTPGTPGTGAPAKSPP